MADVEQVERRAIISVADKTEIAEFAAGLQEALPELRIISTGATARVLSEAGVEVTTVEDVTGFPEMLEGRVKTLHPVIHGGILADLDNPRHTEDLIRHNITPVDMVVVNLYPFEQTIARPDVTRRDAIENIDIGGVTLIRAAAKNADRVAVICDPADYAPVLAELRSRDGLLTQDTREALAVKAFALTSRYDAAITAYLNTPEGEQFAQRFALFGGERGGLRYGENPHQKGEIYPLPTDDPLAWFRFDIVQGKQMGFNNWLDLSAAVDAISYLGGEKPASIIVKHTNPCGSAYGEHIIEAFQKSWDGDALAAFGGIVVVNRPIDEALAEQMTKGRFLEVIAAPVVTTAAREILARKTDLRVLVNPALMDPSPSRDLNMKQVRGGMLVQEADTIVINPDIWEVLTETAPTPEQVEDLLLAWQLCRTSKSNTITIVRDGMLVGSGVGQQDRVRCCELAVGKAVDGHTGEQRASGAVAASDAFFPFFDAPEVLILAGVKAIIQPAGSKRDQETIDLCNAHGVAMVTTGTDEEGNRIRGFKH